MTLRLRNKVALVIGAGSVGPGWGNGKAAAVAYAREGAKVFAIDISSKAARETVEIISAEGGDAVAHTADARSESDVRGAVDICIAKYGRIDVLHLNVGVVKMGGCVELSTSDWQQAIDINLTSCFLACKYVLPIMESQGSGVVITIGSTAGIRWTGVPYISYSVTKGALLQFTQAVALEYARRGIRAVCITPGLMDTPLIYNSLSDAYGKGDHEKMVEERNAQCPTGFMGNAWDVAKAATFIASDEARYITGINFLVDGGLTAKFC